MSTIRVARRKRYATIARETVNDVRLSYRARGVLCWLLDKPDDWSADSESIAAQGKEGRDAVRTALKELERIGYLRRAKRQTDAGLWVTEWTVFERPPGTENQSSDNRASDSQALRDRRLILKKKASQECVTCRGEGWAYSATAGVEGPCDCTKTLALRETA